MRPISLLAMFVSGCASTGALDVPADLHGDDFVISVGNASARHLLLRRESGRMRIDFLERYPTGFVPIVHSRDLDDDCAQWIGGVIEASGIWSAPEEVLLPAEHQRKLRMRRGGWEGHITVEARRAGLHRTITVANMNHGPKASTPLEVIASALERLADYERCPLVELEPPLKDLTRTWGRELNSVELLANDVVMRLHEFNELSGWWRTVEVQHRGDETLAIYDEVDGHRTSAALDPSCWAKLDAILATTPSEIDLSPPIVFRRPRRWNALLEVRRGTEPVAEVVIVFDPVFMQTPVPLRDAIHDALGNECAAGFDLRVH